MYIYNLITFSYRKIIQNMNIYYSLFLIILFNFYYIYLALFLILQFPKIFQDLHQHQFLLFLYLKYLLKQFLYINLLIQIYLFTFILQPFLFLLIYFLNHIFIISNLYLTCLIFLIILNYFNFKFFIVIFIYFFTTFLFVIPQLLLIKIFLHFLFLKISFYHLINHLLHLFLILLPIY